VNSNYLKQVNSFLEKQENNKSNKNKKTKTNNQIVK
jgi:hypothetical protein